MRPLALTIEGLTSFRTTQEIDFSELDLFVITGPTGAGKSSILDAITFALYGSVPARRRPRAARSDLARLLVHARAASTSRSTASVTESRGAWGRTRTKRRSSGSQNGSSITEVEQGGIRAVNDRLEEIVGLDFKAFTKAVLLPQGAFHEFLTGEVDERRRILVRLLDLGRYEAARPGGAA